MPSALTHLECSQCKKQFQAGKVHNLCDCGGPLLVRYDLELTRRTWNRDRVADGPIVAFIDGFVDRGGAGACAKGDGGTVPSGGRPGSPK